MDNIGVFGTFGRKTLTIVLICIGDGIRDSLFNTIPTDFLLSPYSDSGILIENAEVQSLLHLCSNLQSLETSSPSAKR